MRNTKSKKCSVRSFNVAQPLLGRGVKCLILGLVFSAASDLWAQTTGAMVEQAGPVLPGFTNTKSLTPNALGVGKLLTPDGWQEVRWCQPVPGPEQRGLIVTREFCHPNVVGINERNLNDFIFRNVEPAGSGGGGGNTEPQFSNVPIPVTLGPIPFSLYSPYTSGTVHAASPLVTLRNGQQPIFQARTVDYPNGLPNSGSVKSRFIVMPDGNCGINNEDPRAALDVMDANTPNMPVAIFGNALPFNQTNLPVRSVNGIPIDQTYSRHLAIVPRLNAYGFNMISRSEDMGLFLPMVWAWMAVIPTVHW